MAEIPEINTPLPTTADSEALRVNEDHLREALDALPILLWTAHADGLVDSCNGRWREYTGLTTEQSLGRGWMAVLHPEDMKTTSAAIGQAFEQGDPYQVEQRLRRHDGEYRWFLARGTPVRDPTGKVLRWHGANVDIHSRKEAEEALRENESRWAFAIEGTGLGVLDWNIRTGELRFSDSWLRLAGYSRDELPPQIESLTGLVHPEELPLALADVQEVLEGRKAVHTIEHRLKHRSGHWIWVQSRSLVSAWGDDREPLRMIGTHLDITEHRRAEGALRTTTRLLEQTFEQSPLPMVLVTMPEMNLRIVNPAAQRFLGIEDEPSVIDTPLLGLQPSWRDFDPDGKPGLLENLPLARSLRGEKTVGEERRIVRKNGTIGYELVNAAPIFDDAGHVIAGYLIMTDITERKLAQDEKARLEAQLQQAHKLESVGRLAGGIAHDFNNMLGVIVGHTELAIDEVGASQPLRADLEEIQKAAMHSAELTGQLLAFARKQTISPVVLSLNETVAGMLRMLPRLLGEHIAVRWTPEPALWHTKADPSQVDQILANLCINARDAISGVGTLTIETGNHLVDEAYCALHPEAKPGEYVRLVVSDDGCGMDQETLSHLFEPFFTTKVLGKGTGLGLATVYGIVKQHGGFIEVHSEPGSGTTFTISFPRFLAAGEAGPARSEGAGGPVLRGHETILLVEDEPGILRVAKRMLELQGYVVLAASTPGDAIQLFGEHPEQIDLLMTDVVMPQMNGRELADLLQSRNPRLKRLFMSGYTADVIAHHGVLADGVHFLQKPFSIAHLTAAVRAALDQ